MRNNTANRLRHWWQDSAAGWREDARLGEMLLEAACELERLQAVAEAADTVIANLGMLGEITTDHPTVDALLDALYEWKPA